MTEPPDHAEAAKQGLRNLYVQIVMDFDRHAGAFAGLHYYSPWIIATEEWADRSGHAVDELREMITQMRLTSFAKREAAPRIVRTFEDLRRAVDEWRKETGYNDPPTHVRPEDARFDNYKEMKAHIWKQWSALGLDQPDVGYFVRDLSFSGFLTDRFSHRVSLRMTIKMGYGGPIWARFRFPYYGSDDPTSFGLTVLMAGGLMRDLRLPQMSELEWVAGKSKADFKEVDSVLSIIKAIISYLRPTVH